jgi:hypothetical protein
MAQFTCRRKYFSTVEFITCIYLTSFRILSYQMWNLFFGYASFLSAFVSIALFAGPKLVKVAKLLLTREKRQDEDKLNKLMSPYKDVPLWWYLTLFLICFITNMVLIFKEQLYLPWWTFIVALVIGALTVVVCHIITMLSWSSNMSSNLTFIHLAYGIRICNQQLPS